jgi:hypothetical protein
MELMISHYRATVSALSNKSWIVHLFTLDGHMSKNDQDRHIIKDNLTYKSKSPWLRQSATTFSMTRNGNPQEMPMSRRQRRPIIVPISQPSIGQLQVSCARKRGRYMCDLCDTVLSSGCSQVS